MKNMPWRDFTALVASIGVVGLGLGATIPLTALSLDQRGIGSGVIGMITAISAFGILGAAPFVSRWVAGHGPRGCMIGAILAAALSTALMEATDNLLAWGLLRLVFGACMGVLWLADHVGRRRVHVGCGVAACVLLPILPFAASTSWLWWTLLLVLGAVAGAIYMLSLVACGERFEGQSLVAASAVVNASWGITSAGGPLVTGVLMQTAGVNALPAVLSTGAAIFIASAMWDRD